jgi:hypothetical protein
VRRRAARGTSALEEAELTGAGCSGRPGRGGSVVLVWEGAGAVQLRLGGAGRCSFGLGEIGRGGGNRRSP